MKFELIAITDRLPVADNFKNRLDTIVFYDVNGVKHLINKSTALSIDAASWIDKGFEYWLEEKEKANR